MPPKSRGTANAGARAKELVITRVFDAPRAWVWKAWTDRKDIRKWWGPKDFTAPHVTIDLRVGGKWLYCMRGTGLDGVVRDFWNTGEFLEMVPMEKIVSTVRFADERGNPVPASKQGLPGDWPDAVRETVTFEDVAGVRKTKVTIREVGIPDVMAQMADLGWKQSLDKLAAVVEDSSAMEVVTDRGKRQIVMSRVFDAPRERVFRAYTDPKMIPRWWGQTTTVDVMELRKGGRWRYVSRDKDGREFAFRGEYQEVVPPERLVSTFEFEGRPGVVIQQITTFEDLGGRTKLTLTQRFDSIEDLEGVVKAGAEAGARETWNRLAELLARM